MRVGNQEHTQFWENLSLFPYTSTKNFLLTNRTDTYFSHIYIIIEVIKMVWKYPQYEKNKNITEKTAFLSSWKSLKKLENPKPHPDP